jgi:hypothetical protein
MYTSITAVTGMRACKKTQVAANQPSTQVGLPTVETQFNLHGVKVLQNVKVQFTMQACAT